MIKHLCLHGMPVGQGYPAKVGNCAACRSSKRVCRACRKIRYAMRGVGLAPKLVECRVQSQWLSFDRFFGRPGETAFVDYVNLMFPICQPCWRSRTPDQRLTYFRELWLESKPGPQHLDEWFAIEAAVLGDKELDKW